MASLPYSQETGKDIYDEYGVPWKVCYASYLFANHASFLDSTTFLAESLCAESTYR